MKAAPVLIAIPARMGSTRFPKKPLALLGGLPMIERVRRQAEKAGVGDVVVATDSRDIVRVVEFYGGRAVLTDSRLPSGTDRVLAAARMLERRRASRYRVVVNLQGDEPFISPATIRSVAALAARADIGTAVVPIDGPAALRDSNTVKAVVCPGGRCLYFSRSAVPWTDAAGAESLRHIGIYSFSRAALDRFVRLGPSALEKRERLEQLRALEDGMLIRAAVVADKTLSIDTPADLRRAERRLSSRKRGKRHG